MTQEPRTLPKILSQSQKDLVISACLEDALNLSRWGNEINQIMVEGNYASQLIGDLRTRYQERSRNRNVPILRYFLNYDCWREQNGISFLNIDSYVVEKLQNSSKSSQRRTIPKASLELAVAYV